MQISFKELQFLKDVLSNRATHSNLSIYQLRSHQQTAVTDVNTLRRHQILNSLM